MCCLTQMIVTTVSICEWDNGCFNDTDIKVTWMYLTSEIFVPRDLSRIAINKGIKSRLRWTKNSDWYEIVNPELQRQFFMFVHRSGMRERSIVF